MKSEKKDRQKFFNRLSDKKKDTVAGIARDSLAIETLGELAVYSAALPYKSFVAVTLSKIMSLMGAATGSVFQYNDKTQTASIILWQGMDSEDVEDFARQSVTSGKGGKEHKYDHTGLAANCILKKSPILVNDPLNSPYLSTDYFRRVIVKYNLTSAIALPLIKEGRVYGAMVLFTSGEENKFSEDDVKFLSAVTLPIVSAFEAHKHVSEMSEERSKLWKIMENLSIGIIFADENGTIKNINKTALGLLKMEEGMVIEKPLEKILLENLLSPEDNGVHAPARFNDIVYNKMEERLYVPPRSAKASAPVLWNIKFIKLSDESVVAIFSMSTAAQSNFLRRETALAGPNLKYIKKPLMDIMNEVNIATVSGHLNSRQFDCLTRAQKYMETLWRNLSLLEKTIACIADKTKPIKEIFKPSEVVAAAINRNQEIATTKMLNIIVRVFSGDEDEKSFYGDKKSIEEMLGVVLEEIYSCVPIRASLALRAKIDGEKLKFEIYSDNPGAARIKNELVAQYLRNFFDYTKGEIDFNPPIEPEEPTTKEKTAAPQKTPPQMFKVISFSIPV